MEMGSDERWDFLNPTDCWIGGNSVIYPTIGSVTIGLYIVTKTFQIWYSAGVENVNSCENWTNKKSGRIILTVFFLFRGSNNLNEICYVFFVNNFTKLLLF
jgi:hypothetical protein